MTKTSKIEKIKRRSPISREEGERRLIDAALQLVRERPFSEVGVRDIAQLADVNHGFVHTWFGSKNELLLRAVGELIHSIADKVREVPPGQLVVSPNDPDVVLAVRLTMWLDLEGIQTGGVLNELPVLNELTRRYETLSGLDPSVARTAATHAVAIAIATASFSQMLSLENAQETAAVFQLWQYVLKLLAKYPPA